MGRVLLALLLFHDASGYKIVGDWATSWETSPDGKDWTFHLVPGTKWSDGSPMTADDAAWTINTTVKYADGPTAVAARNIFAAPSMSSPCRPWPAATTSQS